MVEECRNLLLTVMVQVDTENVSRWTHDPAVGYMVSGAYQTLTVRTPPTNHVHAALLWTKDVPQKVSVFVGGLYGQ